MEGVMFCTKLLIVIKNCIVDFFLALAIKFRIVNYNEALEEAISKKHLSEVCILRPLTDGIQYNKLYCNGYLLYYSTYPANNHFIRTCMAAEAIGEDYLLEKIKECLRKESKTNLLYGRVLFGFVSINCCTVLRKESWDLIKQLFNPNENAVIVRCTRQEKHHSKCIQEKIKYSKLIAGLYVSDTALEFLRSRIAKLSDADDELTLFSLQSKYEAGILRNEILYNHLSIYDGIMRDYNIKELDFISLKSATVEKYHVYQDIIWTLFRNPLERDELIDSFCSVELREVNDNGQQICLDYDTKRIICQYLSTSNIRQFLCDINCL